jgi:arabinose-5-phosphate isomerase
MRCHYPPLTDQAQTEVPLQKPQSLARAALNIEAQALMQASTRLNSVFDQAIDCLLSAQGKVVLLGLGKSGLVAQKIAATLCSTGTPAVFLHAAEALHGDLGIYQPGDPTILISKSGSTTELLQILPTLRKFKSPLIGILGNLESPLARGVDYALDARVDTEADPLGIVPTASTTLAMALGDALAAALMQSRNFLQEDFARYHPSGQLGKNLTQCVKDAFHPLNRIAIGRPEHSLKSIVIKLSQYPLGAVCLLDDEDHLLGIITDGDIRRALESHDDIRSLTAADFMTAKPTVTHPEVSLHEAILQMEDRASQISVLPVVDSKSLKCLGLIRLHDIYQPSL